MKNRASILAEIKQYISEAYAKSSQWKIPNGSNSDTSESIEITKVGVIGGGTMGRGMALALCLAGYETIIIENDQKSLEFCKKEIDITIRREMKLKRFKEKQAERVKSSALRVSLLMEDLNDCELVIEAVFEEMNLKKELFKKLQKICSSGAIFGTNTSSLNIDEMASVLENPSRLVGIHFFNPAHVIRMVEIVYGTHTSGTAVATAFKVCQDMQKVAILVGNCPSFVFNRLLAVYVQQSHKLMYQYGLLPKDIDSIVTSRGFMMGPVTMLDMNGIDVMAKVKKAHNVPLNVLEEELLRLNRFGRKNGKGFYSYDEKTRKKCPDLHVDTFIREVAAKASPDVQFYCDQDIMDFLLFPMINEGYLCLEEGMIHHEPLIDIMFILGFGWPPHTGGPMRWGHSLGLRKIGQTMRLWHDLNPNERSYKLSKTLKKYALEEAHL